MKNLRLIAVALITITFIACSKDDVIAIPADTTTNTDNTDTGNTDTGNTDTGVTTDSILGVWTGVSNNYSGTTITSSGGIEAARATFVGETTEADYTVEFTENPNSSVGKGSYTIKLTTTTTTFGISNTQEQSIPVPFSTTATWSKSGNELTVVNSLGESQKATIIELTATKLVYETELETTTTSNGFDVKSIVKSTSVFKR